MIIGKTILITGGAGSIGSELARQLSKNNKVICLDQDESGLFDLSQEIKIILEIGNIRDYQKLSWIFKKYKPKIVFHTAAYKHLSNFEQEHFYEIVETNVIGTENVLMLAKEFGVKKFIFISTDKAVNPTSLMGATKLVGEIITRRNGYTVVRFGNVIRSRGSVIPIWERQIARGKPVTITDLRMERYFMTIKQACELVIKATKIGKGGETIILNMGERRKIIDILIETFGDIPYKIIGKKEGEKLEEELMTEVERKIAIKKGQFWIIPKTT